MVEERLDVRALNAWIGQVTKPYALGRKKMSKYTKWKPATKDCNKRLLNNKSKHKRVQKHVVPRAIVVGIVVVAWRKNATSMRYGKCLDGMQWK